MAVDQHLQPGEEVLYRAHPSRVPLVAPLAGVVLLAVAAGIVLSRMVATENRAFTMIGFAVPILFLLAVAGVRYLRLISREYILTNHRLIQQEGILAKKSMDSYLEKINNIEYAQTFWGRLLGYGDLRIDTANVSEPSVFERIADPLGFKRAISGAAETYRAGLSRPAAPLAAAATTPTGAERLRQLKALLDDGLISQAEFEVKRKQLLDEI
jgi:uncharacterized membrane protein YdbT with pleckstrin-like domain